MSKIINGVASEYDIPTNDVEIFSRWQDPTIEKLQQENQLLKRVKQYCPYDKKCGELYDCTKEEYETMKQSNVKLSLKYDKLKEIIEEVKTGIITLIHRTRFEEDFCEEDIELEKLLETLDKAKDIK